jgi:hypothetical protein
MAITVTTLAARLSAATASDVATQIGGGTTAAQVTALANLLTVLAGRADLLRPLLGITGTGKTEFTIG